MHRGMVLHQQRGVQMVGSAHSLLDVFHCLNAEGGSCVRIVLKLIGEKDCNYMTPVTLDTLFSCVLLFRGVQGFFLRS